MFENHPTFCKERVIIQAVQADNIDRESGLLYLKRELKINTSDRKVLKVVGYPQRNKHQYVSKVICNNFKEKDILKYYLQLLDKIKSFTASDIKVLFKTNKDIEQEFNAIMSMERLFIFDNVVQNKEYIKYFTCPVGIDNIFISTNGDIHICNKTDYSYPLGNVYNGIDTNTIEKFHSAFYKEIREKCSSCWAIHFCNVCPAGILNDKKFIHPNKAECKHIKKDILISIKKFILLLHNEELYEKIEKYFQEKEVSYLNYDGPINIKDYS